MFESKRGKLPSRAHLRTLVRGAQDHRDELLGEWEQKVQVQPNQRG